MDDHFDSGRGAAFRFVKSIVKDFLYDICCYAIGWIILRFVTAGKYPSEALSEGVKDPESSESIPCIVGLITICVIAYVVFS